MAVGLSIMQRFLNQTHAWFLRADIYACVRVCLCERACATKP